MSVDLVFALLDYAGIGFFAFSGGMLAARKSLDPFGAAIIGAVTGMGGGTLRDVLLGSLPVYWIREPEYLWIALAGAALLTGNALAQTDVTQAAREYREANEAEILTETLDFLRLPNVADNREDILANARHIIALMEARGIEGRILEAGDASPAVYGELNVPGATRTLMLYTHYDGQPVEPENWASDPFDPIIRAGRLEDGAGTVDDPLAGEIGGRTKSFTQTLRARSDRVERIPPIPFTYFDPERGEYVTLHSAPVPLVVAPAAAMSRTFITAIGVSTMAQIGFPGPASPSAFAASCTPAADSIFGRTTPSAAEAPAMARSSADH